LSLAFGFRFLGLGLGFGFGVRSLKKKQQDFGLFETGLRLLPTGSGVRLSFL